MDVALVNGRVLAGASLRDGLAVRISGERIVAVGPRDQVEPGAQSRDLGGAILLPGFIDVQVNGGGGVLFNDAPTVETIAAIGAAHRRFGATGFLPTLISDDLEVVGQALAAARAAIVAGVPGVLGAHIEGPFLNPRRKGIHEASKLRTLDEDAFRILTGPGPGKTLLTLAPEATTPETIQRLTDAGVLVSAGHTNATYGAVRAALAHGLRGFTHLFNAMSPLTSREPGVVGAALEDATAWCSLIVDGRHVDPVVLKLALRCRPHERFILVTDAMPSVGAKVTSFTLQGKQIAVRGGVCVDANGTLAGSNLDMASAVRNTVRLVGLDLPEAARMASLYPAAFLGLDHELGRIAAGYRADLVLVDDDVQVLETWIAGRDSRQDAGQPSEVRHG